jgi:hypothetical protein
MSFREFKIGFVSFPGSKFAIRSAGAWKNFGVHSLINKLYTTLVGQRSADLSSGNLCAALLSVFW